jgi:hypothetical protein
MSRANHTSKQKRRNKTLPALGAAGLSTSGAHAATDGTAADRPALNTVISQEFTLAEDEISDVSLKHVFCF